MKTKDETSVYTKPTDWNNEVQGTCGNLSVRKEKHHGNLCLVSTWKPDAEELRRLNLGCCIELTCVGVQPPVCLTVTPESWLPTEPTEEDRRRWAEDMRDGM